MTAGLDSSNDVGVSYKPRSHSSKTGLCFNNEIVVQVMSLDGGLVSN